MLYNYPSKVYNSVGLTQSQSCATMTTINFRTLPSLQKETLGVSLGVQWIRLYTPNAGGPGSIPSQGTRSSMLQLRVCMPQRRLKILHATTKTQCSQINKQIKYLKPNKRNLLAVTLKIPPTSPALGNQSVPSVYQFHIF